MKFSLEITCDNAAFHGDGDDESPVDGREVSRILKVLVNKIDMDLGLEDGDEGRLMDINGNKVGHWKMEKDN